MKPSERDFLFYLEDISLSIVKIRECVGKFSNSTELENDWLHYDAVLRNLEVIGEAANHLPDHLKLTHPEIPWLDMYRTRNVLAHQYFGVDSQIIWQIATIHLPECFPLIQNIIDFYKNQE